MLRVTSADVPVAALVSGGLDSAIVYTLAKRFGTVHPYHVDNGEVEQAAVVLQGDQYTFLKSDAVPTRKALRYMQEPVDLGSLKPQVALSDSVGASGGERVCLTGDGADELFGGYGRARRYDSQASDIWHELVCWHLPRLDRVMMRNQIEVRSPFLARPVLAAALALPYSERCGKQVLRNLFRTELPRGIADVAKRPLRTKEVEVDREANSKKLVDEFRQMVWYSKL
jgi:asparagine synthase (glutamine-hydrolysing)